MISILVYGVRVGVGCFVHPLICPESVPANCIPTRSPPVVDGPRFQKGLLIVPLNPHDQDRISGTSSPPSHGGASSKITNV